MPMSDEIKARLKEIAKRNRGVLLKDLDPTFLKVACDAVIEKYSDMAGLEWTDRLDMAHPKRWKQEQWEAVLPHLPHRWAVVRDPTGIGTGRRTYRVVPMFLRNHLLLLLETCGIAKGKIRTYAGWWKPACEWPAGLIFTDRDAAEKLAAVGNGG